MTNADTEVLENACLSEIVGHAAGDPDRTVEIVDGDRHGLVVTIDGVPIPDSESGFPWETFIWPLDDLRLDEEPRELAAEIIRDRKRESNRNRLGRIDTGRAEGFEGVEL